MYLYTEDNDHLNVTRTTTARHKTTSTSLLFNDLYFVSLYSLYGLA